MRVKVIIYPAAGQRFAPNHFEVLIGRELKRHPGGVRAWLVAAEVADDGASAELTADLVERHVALEEEEAHGQGV
jgi:hypothetical protein